MYKRYFRKKDPNCGSNLVNWIEMTGQEFFHFVNSPEGQGRYFIDMGDVVLETTKSEACTYRAEQNHSNYLKAQEEGWNTISLYSDCVCNGEDVVKDELEDVEVKAIARIERNALHMALLYLDKDSATLIKELYFAEQCKTERQLAKEMGVSQSAISKRKKKILKNLKFLVVKFQKSQQ